MDDDKNNNLGGEISDFYHGKSVFITGATGFMGKVLVHKLLDSCPGLEKIYVLIRPKRNELPAQRLNNLFQTPLFSRWADEKSPILNKVEALAGDITLPKLGLSDQDIQTVIEKVSVVFHSAATVRFDEELKKSVVMNVEGTRSVMELGRKMRNLEVLVHVSTAYAHCNQSKTIEEKFYLNARVNPHEIIEECKKHDKSFDTKEEADIIGEHPNSYTFTKALTEQMLLQSYPDLPLVIVRPSIVVASWKDPLPGWIDNYNGPTGILAGFATGILRTMVAFRDNVADIIPVDVAINVLIVAAWKVAGEQQSSTFKPPIYNITSGGFNPITWGKIEDWVISNVYKFPFETIFWYPGGSFKHNALWDRVCRWMFHYAPAYAMDFFLMITWQKPFMRKLAFKATKGIEALRYFTVNEWSWTNDNLDKLKEDLAKTDGQSMRTFDFDISSMDWKKFWEQYVLGTRHYLLKNKPSTLEASRKKLQKFYLLHLLVQVGFVLFICYLLMS